MSSSEPTRIVALGHHAYRLLSRHVPEVRPMLGRMWHFAYVVRYNKLEFDTLWPTRFDSHSFPPILQTQLASLLEPP